MPDNTTNSRVMVRFVANCSPYISGERAAFPKTAADRLINRRVAVLDKDTSKSVEYDEEENPDDYDEPNDGNGTASEGDDAGAGSVPKKGKKSKSAKGKQGKRKRVKADD